MRRFRALQPLAVSVSLLLAIMAASAPSSAQDPDVDVLTWQNDTHRTGQNLNESTLVSLTGFGQLCNIPVDGQVYSQPLVVADVKFNGSTNPYTSVVYVVTQYDSVYAINGTPGGTDPAHCPAAPQILGQQSLLTYTINGIKTAQYPVDCTFIGDPLAPCQTIKPYVGILGTPVISLSGVGVGTLYLVTENQDKPIGMMPTTWYHWLHALDIQTLKELSGYPVLVYPPAYSSDPSRFSKIHIQRPGLLYVSPYVYIAFSMMDGNVNPLPEGWILGYDTTSPSTAPNYFSATQGISGSAGGGVWQGGAGLAYGLNKGGTGGKNFIYFNTGNGDFSQSSQANVCTNCSDSFIELDPSTSPMTVADYFTPNDQFYRNCPPPNYTDMDFGSGGVMLIPDGDLLAWPSLAVTGDKEGALWFMNRANAGEYTTPNNCSTTCPTACSQTDQIADNVQTYWPPDNDLPDGPVIHTNPSYWESGPETSATSYLYVAPLQQALTRYTLCSGTGATAPIGGCGASISAVDNTGTAVHFKYGATPTISANGNMATDSIVWAIWQDGSPYDAKTIGPPPTTGILYAFDAGSTGTSMPQLYSSNNTCLADEMNPGTKFSVPTVANGYVYVGGQSDNKNILGQGTVYIFGLGRTGC